MRKLRRQRKRSNYHGNGARCVASILGERSADTNEKLYFCTVKLFGLRATEYRSLQLHNFLVTENEVAFVENSKNEKIREQSKQIMTKYDNSYKDWISSWICMYMTKSIDYMSHRLSIVGGDNL